ncbi:hypothetical protein WR25_01044 [Diploscapter pachys]|uniref:Ig-like domain-containing protein n=1 Tax=Diploscapter pachys TaxID=2018661 RepID=A0A2A2JT09_9BILA|nr:hypothetical protein WR25_01044 [Diploscapter pachys]
MKLLILFSLQILALIVSGDCPIGWHTVGDECVKLHTNTHTAEEATSHCEAQNSYLVCPIAAKDDLINFLDDAFELGLQESTWIVNKGRALQRHNGTFRLVTVPLTSSFPFICHLDSNAKKSLTFQQQLLPKNVPFFTSTSQSVIYFHARENADFLPISCPISTQHSANIQWYQNDMRLIDASKGDSSVLFSGATLLLSSTPAISYSSFHCLAKTEFGSIRSSSVLLKPSFIDPFPVFRPPSFPFVHGGIHLPCLAPDHQPKYA